MEQISNLNSFQIEQIYEFEHIFWIWTYFEWNRFLMEQISNLNNFRIEQIFEFEQILKFDKFQIWIDFRI
jgi:hypothetical protein